MSNQQQTKNNEGDSKEGVGDPPGYGGEGGAASSREMGFEDASRKRDEILRSIFGDPPARGGEGRAALDRVFERMAQSEETELEAASRRRAEMLRSSVHAGTHPEQQPPLRGGSGVGEHKGEVRSDDSGIQGDGDPREQRKVCFQRKFVEFALAWPELIAVYPRPTLLWILGVYSNEGLTDAGGRTLAEFKEMAMKYGKNESMSQELPEPLLDFLVCETEIQRNHWKILYRLYSQERRHQEESSFVAKGYQRVKKGLETVNRKARENEILSFVAWIGWFFLWDSISCGVIACFFMLAAVFPPLFFVAVSLLVVYAVNLAWRVFQRGLYFSGLIALITALFALVSYTVTVVIWRLAGRHKVKEPAVEDKKLVQEARSKRKLTGDAELDEYAESGGSFSKFEWGVLVTGALAAVGFCALPFVGIVKAGRYAGAANHLIRSGEHLSTFMVTIKEVVTGWFRPTGETARKMYYLGRRPDGRSYVGLIYYSSADSVPHNPTRHKFAYYDDTDSQWKLANYLKDEEGNCSRYVLVETDAICDLIDGVFDKRIEAIRAKTEQAALVQWDNGKKCYKIVDNATLSSVSELPDHVGAYIPGQVDTWVAGTLDGLQNICTNTGIVPPTPPPKTAGIGFVAPVPIQPGDSRFTYDMGMEHFGWTPKKPTGAFHATAEWKNLYKIHHGIATAFLASDTAARKSAGSNIAESWMWLVESDSQIHDFEKDALAIEIATKPGKALTDLDTILVREARERFLEEAWEISKPKFIQEYEKRVKTMGSFWSGQSQKHQIADYIVYFAFNFDEYIRRYEREREATMKVARQQANVLLSKPKGMEYRSLIDEEVEIPPMPETPEIWTSLSEEMRRVYGLPEGKFEVTGDGNEWKVRDESGREYTRPEIMKIVYDEDVRKGIQPPRHKDEVEKFIFEAYRLEDGMSYESWSEVKDWTAEKAERMREFGSYLRSKCCSWKAGSAFARWRLIAMIVLLGIVAVCATVLVYAQIKKRRKDKKAGMQHEALHDFVIEYDKPPEEGSKRVPLPVLEDSFLRILDGPGKIKDYSFKLPRGLNDRTLERVIGSKSGLPKGDYHGKLIKKTAEKGSVAYDVLVKLNDNLHPLRSEAAVLNKDKLKRSVAHALANIRREKKRAMVKPDEMKAGMPVENVDNTVEHPSVSETLEPHITCPRHGLVLVRPMKGEEEEEARKRLQRRHDKCLAHLALAKESGLEKSLRLVVEQAVKAAAAEVNDDPDTDEEDEVWDRLAEAAIELDGDGREAGFFAQESFTERQLVQEAYRAIEDMELYIGRIVSAGGDYKWQSVFRVGYCLLMNEHCLDIIDESGVKAIALETGGGCSIHVTLPYQRSDWVKVDGMVDTVAMPVPKQLASWPVFPMERVYLAKPGEVVMGKFVAKNAQDGKHVQDTISCTVTEDDGYPSVEYETDHKAGLCGNPVFTDEERFRLLGLHMLGANKKHPWGRQNPKVCRATAFTRQSLDCIERIGRTSPVWEALARHSLNPKNLPLGRK